MDELSSLLGVQQSPEQVQALSELARRANDRLRVQNLLDQDYHVSWALYDDKTPGGRFLIPGKNRDIGYGLGQAVHPRYIAFKFFKEITTIILSAEMQMKINEENAKRAERGAKKMDKSFETGEELTFVMSNNLLPNSQDKLLELLPKIILGVEEEWGMDALPYQKSEDRVKWDEVMAIVNKPLHSQKPSTEPQGYTMDNTPMTVAPTSETDVLKEIENGGN